MRADWTLTRLGNLVAVEHGWPFKSNYFSEELIGRPIVVNIGNFQYSGGFRFESTTLKEYRGDFPKQYILKPDEILVVMTCQTAGGEILGVPGRIPRDGRTYLHNQRMGRIRIQDPDTIDASFVYYLFLSPEFKRHLFVTASGTKILHTSPSRIENFEFPLPPLAEQRVIGTTLRLLDARIELNRRTNETLEAVARTIFKSWLVDFDPVRSKAEGRQPFGMDAATAALFPSGFELSSSGKIPKGWEATSLDQIANFLNGLALQKYRGGDTNSLPAIKIAQLRRGNSEGADPVSDKIPPEYLLNDGDLLFSWSGSLEVAIWCGGPGALNQHLFKVSSARYPKWFYYQWILEHLEDFRHIAAGKATTMGHIQRHHLSDAKVIVPPPQLIKALNRIMAPLLDKTISNSLESRTLAAIRDLLLPKLISGEIRIKDAEKIVGEKV